MDGIIEGVKAMFSGVIGKLHNDIIQSLENQGISLTNAQLTTLSTKFKNTANPFDKLSTRSQQDKYIQEYLNYLVT